MAKEVQQICIFLSLFPSSVHILQTTLAEDDWEPVKLVTACVCMDFKPLVTSLLHASKSHLLWVNILLWLNLYCVCRVCFLLP